MLLYCKMEERIKAEAEYVIKYSATVREAARKFGVSKTTVHKDITDRLLEIDMTLHTEVREVLNFNISQRAHRGGEATKKKYKK